MWHVLYRSVKATHQSELQRYWTVRLEPEPSPPMNPYGNHWQAMQETHELTNRVLREAHWGISLHPTAHCLPPAAHLHTAPQSPALLPGCIPVFANKSTVKVRMQAHPLQPMHRLIPAGSGSSWRVLAAAASHFSTDLTLALLISRVPPAARAGSAPHTPIRLPAHPQFRLQ